MPTINPVDYRRQTTATLYIAPTGSTNNFKLGDVSTWSLTPEVKRTPIMDSEKGFRQKTRELVSEVGWQYDVTINEMTPEIMELVHLGTSGSDVVQTLISAPSGTASFAAVKYRCGLFLGKESVNTVVVKNSSNTVTYVENTDYILDADAGVLEIKSGGSIAEGVTINVTFGCSATTRSKVNPLLKLYASGNVTLNVFDQHDPRPVETHTFPCQYYVTDWGKNDGGKILEVSLRLIATSKPVQTGRK